MDEKKCGEGMSCVLTLVSHVSLRIVAHTNEHCVHSLTAIFFKVVFSVLTHEHRKSTGVHSRGAQLLMFTRFLVSTVSLQVVQDVQGPEVPLHAA